MALRKAASWFTPDFDASTEYTNSPTVDPQSFCCESRVDVYAFVPHFQIATHLLLSRDIYHVEEILDVINELQAVMTWTPMIAAFHALIRNSS